MKNLWTISIIGLLLFSCSEAKLPMTASNLAGNWKIYKARIETKTMDSDLANGLEEMATQLQYEFDAEGYFFIRDTQTDMPPETGLWVLDENRQAILLKFDNENYEAEVLTILTSSKNKMQIQLAIGEEDTIVYFMKKAK